MVLANLYFKGVGSTQTLIFSPNTVFHVLFALHPGITVPCLFSSVSFDLCPATAFLHQSLKSSNRPSNRFPQGNYHHISYIRAIKSGVLTTLIQKICHKGLLHLQKNVSQPFSVNHEPHTETTNLNIQKWHLYHHGCQGRKLQRKKTLFSQGERLIGCCSNCSKLKLPIPDASASNKLIFDGKIARS